jgi:diaminopimelate epimerase
LNTGSPHHVQLVDDLENYILRKTEPLSDMVICMESGSNINFVNKLTIPFLLRTYERGVEDEHSLVVQAPQQLQQ